MSLVFLPQLTLFLNFHFVAHVHTAKKATTTKKMFNFFASILRHFLRYGCSCCCCCCCCCCFWSTNWIVETKQFLFNQTLDCSIVSKCLFSWHDEEKITIYSRGLKLKFIEGPHFQEEMFHRPQFRGKEFLRATIL